MRTIPGLPQGTQRDAGTGSGTEKCRTFFCRGKEHHRENTDTLKKVAEELSQLGGILGGFFSLYSSDPVLRANLHTAAELRFLCSRCS